MTSVVYFVECSATGRVKIGMSDDLTRRLVQLNSTNCAPVRLVGAMSGSAAVEQHVHAKFAGSRLHGEWFAPSDELWSFIERVNHGQFSFEAVAVVSRLPKPEFAEDLVTAKDKLQCIGGTSPHTKTRLKIEYAANACGLSYWRTFDLWYGKARQITSVEFAAIAARAQHLAAGE